MRLIFNNHKEPNKEINFGQTYVLAAALLALSIALYFLFDWGMFVLIAALSLLLNLFSVYQITVEVSDVDLEIENRNVFINRRRTIPFHKLQSWRLMSKSNDRIELYYSLKDQKEKRILISSHAKSDKEMISLLKKSLEENEILKLNKIHFPKES